MTDFVSPKQVARAIQVSESSVKRWCDKGVIPFQKTAGGHRRIPVGGLLDFLRSKQQPLVRPEVLGLPATTGQTVRVIDRAAEPLREALLSGDEEACRQIALDLYLAEHSISAICDRVFATAFVEIGSQWECGDAEVYQERRGCEIALRVVREMRSLLTINPQAGLAIGGAAEGDQYQLGTAMAELVLRDCGWNATSLGSNLPFETLAEAIKDQRPGMFWLSCSYIPDEELFVAQYMDLFDQFGLDVPFVVGGRALTESLRSRLKYAAFCDRMQHLDSFAQTFRTTVDPS